MWLFLLFARAGPVQDEKGPLRVESIHGGSVATATSAVKSGSSVRSVGLLHRPKTALETVTVNGQNYDVHTMVLLGGGGALALLFASYS
jgi:hypothetical protein